MKETGRCHVYIYRQQTKYTHVCHCVHRWALQAGRSSGGSSGPYPGGEAGRSSRGSSGPYPGGEVGRSSGGVFRSIPRGEVGGSGGGSSGPYTGGGWGDLARGGLQAHTQRGGWGVSRPRPRGECVSQLALRQYAFYWNAFLFVNTFPFVSIAVQISHQLRKTTHSFCPIFLLRQTQYHLNLDTTAKLEHSQCPLVEVDSTTSPHIFLSLIMNLAILTFK